MQLCCLGTFPYHYNSCCDRSLTLQAAVARASALSRANKRTANPPKDRAPKARRNKQAAAPASGENAMDLD